jgi:tyrosine-protein kinase Etk/Wzc
VAKALTAQRLVRRNRWLIIGAPLVTLAAAAVFVAVATPVYETTASLRLDKERSNLAVLDALQELSTGSEINTEMAELRSRSLAERVVSDLSLHAELVHPRKTTRSSVFAQIEARPDARALRYELTRGPDGRFTVHSEAGSRVVRVGEPVQVAGLSFVLAPAAARQERIEMRVRSFPIAVRNFRRTLAIGRPDREANIVDVRWEGTDRVLAQAIPNQVARQFIARRDQVRKTQARSTVQFLEQQIDTLGQQLRGSEASVLAFRQQQHVIDPATEAETQVAKLADMQAERDAADAERASLSSVMAEVARESRPEGASPYRRLIGFPSLLRNAAASELLRSLNEVENQRARLLQTRTAEDPDVVLYTRRIEQMENELQGLAGTYLQSLNNTVGSLDAVLARFGADLSRIPAKEIQLARLRRQAKVTEDIYTELQTRLKEAQIAAAVEDPSVRVMDPAIPPLKPIRPNAPLSFTLAIVLGLVLGLGVSFAREQMDNTIHSRDELQEMSGHVPVLGLLPRIRLVQGERRTNRRFFVAARQNGDHAAEYRRVAGNRLAGGAVAEAYRTLRTNIAFTQVDAPPKVLVFTSALPGEGKSTSACNLAITLAQQGLRVALIDADMRRGALHESFAGVTHEPGLSNVLLGSIPAAQALHAVEVEGTHLLFMPTGTTPPNPAELLASPRVPQLLDELKLAVDAVVIDTPPLNIVTDAAILGSRADGVLLVARAGVTERDAYRYALDQLSAVHARVLGCVLNDVDAKNDGYYGKRGAAYYTARPIIS